MKAETQSFLAFVAAGCFAAAIIGVLVWKFSEATPRETVAGMQRTTSSSQSELSYFSAPAPASTMPTAPTVSDLPPLIAALRSDPFLAPNAHISTGTANTPTRLYRPQPDNVSTTTALTVVSTTSIKPSQQNQPEPTSQQQQNIAPQQQPQQQENNQILAQPTSAPPQAPAPQQPDNPRPEPAPQNPGPTSVAPEPEPPAPAPPPAPEPPRVEPEPSTSESSRPE
ncbi:MAG: hypothetical protein Q4A92_06215, partial [Corynebacterium sp.]|nr:hypothetical protein [Corynebacterium sp.]